MKGKNVIISVFTTICFISTLFLNSNPSLATPILNLKMNGETYHLMRPLIKIDDRVYLPLRDASEVFDVKVFWENKTRSITIIGIDKKIVLQVGSKKAIVNGKEYEMDVPPILHPDEYNLNNFTYIPVRYIAQFLDLSFTWDNKTNTLDIAYTPSYFVGGPIDEVYWVHKQDGTLLVSKKRSIPQLVGKTKVKLVGWSHIYVEQVNENSKVLQISDQYGISHENTVDYVVLIYDDHIVQESRVEYLGRKEGMVVKKNYYQGNVVMVDDKILKLVSNSGDIKETYDLAELGGYKETYTVEGIGEDYLLIRPYIQDKLLLINLKTNERIELYKVLLDENGQRLTEVEGSDRIYFVGEEKGILRFEYLNHDENLGKTTYEYLLPIK